jgi:hypothetical protein
VIPYEKKMPLTEELKYFAAHTNGDPVKTADAQNGAEVLEILEKASESLLQDSGLRDKGLKEKDEIEKLYFGHESAVVDNNVEIGRGTKIWHFSHILSGSRIGKNCNIGQNVVIGPDVTIGKQCKIQNNVSVYKGVTLEDGVFCGPSMVFTNIYNPRAEIRKMDQVRPTLVKKGTTIGAKNGSGAPDTCKKRHNNRSQRHHRMRRNTGTILLYWCRRCCNKGRTSPCPDGRESCQTDRVGLRVRRKTGRKIKVYCL